MSPTLVVHIELRIFPGILEKKFETALMVYSGIWGKLIHEKNRSRKSRDIVPLTFVSFSFLTWLAGHFTCVNLFPPHLSIYLSFEFSLSCLPVYQLLILISLSVSSSVIRLRPYQLILYPPHLTFYLSCNLLFYCLSGSPIERLD
jgi:hypothetical protein